MKHYTLHPKWGRFGALTTLLIVTAALWLTACDKKPGNPSALDTPDASAPLQQMDVPSEVKAFDKEMSKKGCELLTGAMVAAMFDVPEGELTQRKIMGCLYSWENEEVELQVSLQSIRVHKTEEMAKTWFKNATTSLTPEQAAAQMEEIKKRMEKKGDLDTKPKKKVANLLGDAIAGSGFTYEDVAGVGDEARVNTADGRLSVRVGNLLFSVGAYKGPGQPPFVPTGQPVKEMIKAATAHSNAWLAKTAPQRTEAAIQVAKAVVDALR